MKGIVDFVVTELQARLPDIDVTINYSKKKYFIYFKKNSEIIYLIDLTSLAKSTCIYEVKTLSDICVLVLKSRGLV